MMNLSLVLLISSLIALFSGASAQTRCTLCPSAGQLPVRWDYTFSNGKTCSNYYTELGAENVFVGSTTCTNGRAAAQTACCSAATPAVPSATSSVSTTTSYSGPSGNEPVCNICRTTEYPGLPSAMMIVRYVGGYTCDEFYHRGRNGMIPDYMCGPTQDFAQVVCGCGVYNPACRANPSACFGATQTSGSTTTYSLTARTSLTAAPRSSPRASTYSSTPGVRNLRGSDADEVEQEQPPQPEAVEIDPSDAAADVSSEMESQA